ncbi:MAG: hypothetical protein Kow0069_34940 [Promethearchaeota archaeon]
MEIALNTYSLRNEWKKIAKRGDVTNVARLCADLGIGKLEWLDRHVDEERIKENLKVFEDHGVQVFAFGPHVKLLAKESDVAKEIEDGRHWLNLAHEHGVAKIRVQVGDGPLFRCFPPMPDFTEEEERDYREMIDEAVELTGKIALPLVEEAERLGVYVAIETHHSYSSNFMYMRGFNEAYGSKYIGWAFDIGNYENDWMRWQALEVIKGRTFYVHAKAYKFDEAGFETTLDYPRAAKTLAEAGFTGEWSIEFEGKMNGVLGAARTCELLRYCLAQVSGKSYSMRQDFPPEKELMKKYS